MISVKIYIAFTISPGPIQSARHTLSCWPHTTSFEAGTVVLIAYIMGQQMMTQVLNPACCTKHDFYIFKQYFVTHGKHMKLKLLCRQIKFDENTAAVICLQLSKSAFAVWRQSWVVRTRTVFGTLYCYSLHNKSPWHPWQWQRIRSQAYPMCQHCKLPAGSSHIKTRTKQTLRSCFFFYCNFCFIF